MLIFIIFKINLLPKVVEKSFTLYYLYINLSIPQILCANGKYANSIREMNIINT